MYPDPASASLLQARAWFQSNHPEGVTVVSVYRNLKQNETTWTTTFKDTGNFPMPTVNNIHTCRRLFQSHYSRLCKLTDVTIRADERDMTLWMVETKPQSISCFNRVTRIFHRRTPITPAEHNTTSSIIIQPSQSRVQREQSSSTSSSDSDINILIKRCNSKILVKPSDVTDDDAPLRIIKNGRNITRSFTNRNSLCRKTFSLVKSRLHEDPVQVRKSFAMTSVKFVPQSSHQDVVSQASSGPQVISSNKEENRTRTEISYDYTLTRNIYLKSKLAEFNNFRNTRRYIISKFGIKGRGTITLKDSTVELANMLQSQSLPIDRSLISLYYEYCKERNIIDDPERELASYALELSQRPVQVR